jgi:subtilase family serine protease
MWSKLKRRLRRLSHNVYFTAVAVFCGTFVSDYIWAKYIASITTATPMVAGIWAVATIVLGAFVVLSYVNDRRMIIPAAIGAFFGTYFAI